MKNKGRKNFSPVLDGALCEACLVKDWRIRALEAANDELSQKLRADGRLVSAAFTWPVLYGIEFDNRFFFEFARWARVRGIADRRASGILLDLIAAPHAREYLEEIMREIRRDVEMQMNAKIVSAPFAPF